MSVNKVKKPNTVIHCYYYFNFGNEFAKIGISNGEKHRN